MFNRIKTQVRKFYHRKKRKPSKLPVLDKRFQHILDMTKRAALIPEKELLELLDYCEDVKLNLKKFQDIPDTQESLENRKALRAQLFCVRAFVNYRKKLSRALK